MNQSMQKYIESKSWTKDQCVHALLYKGRKVEMAAGVSWRHKNANPVVDVRICLFCGAWLPLPEEL